MLENFALIEADFRREYHINLVDSSLSWRQFLALLSGLSADSVFFYHMSKKPVLVESGNDVLADMQRILSSRK